MLKRSEAILAVEDPKATRETFCRAQQALARVYPGETKLLARFDRLIAQLDVQRPIGPDGKHGGRHTATCGCGLEY